MRRAHKGEKPWKKLKKRGLRKIPGEARQAEASTETTLLANYFMQDATLQHIKRISSRFKLLLIF